jgi:hypothetical protein
MEAAATQNEATTSDAQLMKKTMNDLISVI